MPSEFLKEQSHDEWINASGPGKQLFRPIKKICQWQLGDSGDPESGSLGYGPPRGAPVMELGSPLGGRLSGPGFLSHLIIHASLRHTARCSTLEKGRTLLCLSHWPPLWLLIGCLSWQPPGTETNPIGRGVRKAGRDKRGDRERGEREKEERGTERRQGKTCVFSFHYTKSLRRMGEEKNVPVRTGVSGGAGRRAGAIHRHSADKYGTPQNRTLHAWKQWLMNKQQAPRILLINKMIPLGAARARRGALWQPENSLWYILTAHRHDNHCLSSGLKSAMAFHWRNPSPSAKQPSAYKPWPDLFARLLQTV